MRLLPALPLLLVLAAPAAALAEESKPKPITYGEDFNRKQAIQTNYIACLAMVTFLATSATFSDERTRAVELLKYVGKCRQDRLDALMVWMGAVNRQMGYEQSLAALRRQSENYARASDLELWPEERREEVIKIIEPVPSPKMAR